MITSIGWPSTSASVKPNRAVAALFQDRILPSASPETMASIADSMTDRNLASDSRRAVRTFETVTCRSILARTSRLSKGLTIRSSPDSSPLTRVSSSSRLVMTITGISRAWLLARSWASSSNGLASQRWASSSTRLGAAEVTARSASVPQETEATAYPSCSRSSPNTSVLAASWSMMKTSPRSDKAASLRCGLRNVRWLQTEASHTDSERGRPPDAPGWVLAGSSAD
jgi:hypothetical protein